MSGAADLKEDPVLALHLDFFVVQPAREIHRAKDLEHLFGAERGLLLLPRLWPLLLFAARRDRADGRWCGDWLD